MRIHSAVLLCGMAMAVPSFAGDAHLAGKWTGSAVRTICGRPTGSVNVTLTLKNEAYQVGKIGQPLGDVSGELIVGPNNEGIVALKYDPKTARAASFPGSVRRNEGLSLSRTSPLASYWIDLQAGDAALGLGLYQSLKGTMSRANYSCPAMGDQGETVRVSLRKE